MANEIAQCKADGFTPTLALVFLSIRQDYQAVCNLLDSQAIQVFGATTAGEFIDGEVGSGSIAVMLLNLDPKYFHIQFVPISDSSLKDLSRQIGLDGKKAFPNPAFLVSYSGLYTDGEMIVRGIEEVAGDAAVIFWRHGR